MHEVHRIADVPVIFLSVYGQDDTMARTFDMGAADYLVKPFSPTELAARIPVELTNTGYEVLYQLATQAPRVLTHGLLLQRVWGPEQGARAGCCGTW